MAVRLCEFESRRPHHLKVLYSPKKYRNPLKTAGFLLPNVRNGYSLEYGARELRRVVEMELESKIAERLIQTGEYPINLKAFLQDKTIALT